jgi:hypothetical protein
MNQPQGKKLNGLLVAGFIIAIGVLFTVLQVQQSLFQGQLSLPITYDDISYFVDSMRRLNRFYDQGLARLVIDFFSGSSPFGHLGLDTITWLFYFW